MIHFTWRQFRFPVLVVSALLVAVGVLFLFTGPNLAHLYAELKSCTTQSDCAYLSNAVVSQDSRIFNLMTATSVALPALLGIFWGAPLIARELETGTYRLAWSQGVTRSKWIVTKLAVVGVASMIAAGLMSWMLTWWASPIDTVNANRFGTQVFDTQYITPIGYAAFAFAVGVTAGVLWRRTLPAMATTLAVYVGARVPFAMFVRPHLLTPLKQASSISRAGGGFGFEQTPIGLQFVVNGGSRPNSMVFNAIVVGRHGAMVTSHWLKTNCAQLTQLAPGPSRNTSVGPSVKSAAPSGFNECAAKIMAHFHEVLTFQPASRFWPFQWIEGSLYLAVGVALCAFSYWWLRRRIA